MLKTEKWAEFPGNGQNLARSRKSPKTPKTRISGSAPIDHFLRGNRAQCPQKVWGPRNRVPEKGLSRAKMTFGGFLAEIWDFRDLAGFWPKTWISGVFLESDFFPYFTRVYRGLNPENRVLGGQIRQKMGSAGTFRVPTRLFYYIP